MSFFFPSRNFVFFTNGPGFPFSSGSCSLSSGLSKFTTPGKKNEEFSILPPYIRSNAYHILGSAFWEENVKTGVKQRCMLSWSLKTSSLNGETELVHILHCKMQKQAHNGASSTLSGSCACTCVFLCFERRILIFNRIFKNVGHANRAALSHCNLRAHLMPYI